jgi:hypothetical protein
MHDPDNIIINEKLELIIDRLSKMDEINSK